MPSVSVTKNIKAVELMAAADPGDVLIEALRTLGSQAASAARNNGAGAEDELRPSLALVLTVHWE